MTMFDLVMDLIENLDRIVIWGVVIIIGAFVALGVTGLMLFGIRQLF